MIIALIALAFWLWMVISLVRNTKHDMRIYEKNLADSKSDRYHYWSSYEHHSRWQVIRGAIGWFIGGTLVIGFVASMLSLFVVHMMPQSSLRVYHESTTNLRALSVNSDLQGSFFLASGYVDDKQVFRYIVQDEQGGNRLKITDAYNSVVFEDSLKGGTLVRSWGVPENTLWSYAPRELDVQFHVPAGSVVDGYEMTVEEN